MTSDALRRISDREVPLVLTGYVMPMIASNVPVLVGMPGTDDLFVFVFSTEEKLVAAMTSFEIEYLRVAVVTDGRELVDEMAASNDSGVRPYRIRLAVDPYKADNGRMRFVEPRREVVHILSQEGQPYGSERRCCNHCGAMIWGTSSPQFVDNWTDWRASTNNCGRELKS